MYRLAPLSRTAFPSEMDFCYLRSYWCSRALRFIRLSGHPSSLRLVVTETWEKMKPAALLSSEPTAGSSAPHSMLTKVFSNYRLAERAGNGKYTNWVTNLCYEFNSYLIIKQLAVVFEFMWNQTFRLVQKSRQLTWRSIHLWAAAPWSPGLTPPSHRALSSASRAAAETRSHTAWGKHKTVTPQTLQTASYHWDFGFSPFQNSFFKVEVHSVERSYVALQPLQQFYNNALRCGFADLPVLFPLTPWVFFKSEPASKEWGWKDVLDCQAPHVGDSAEKFGNWNHLSLKETFQWYRREIRHLPYDDSMQPPSA